MIAVLRQARNNRVADDDVLLLVVYQWKSFPLVASVQTKTDYNKEKQGE